MPRYLVLARDELIASEGALSHVPQDVQAERHYAADLTIDEIFSHLGSADLFAEQRCYIYADVMGLSLLKSEAARLEEIFQRLPETTILIATQVIEAESGKKEQAQLKSKDLERWRLGATVDDLMPLSQGRQAAVWLVNRASQKYSLTLTSQQVQRILELNSENLGLADGELCKLALIADELEQGQVTDSILGSVLSSSPAAQFYALADALLAGDPRSPVLARAWYQLESALPRLLYELKRRFTGMLALSRGEQVMPPFLSRQLQASSRIWQGQKLARGLRLVARLDYDMKAGMLAGETTKEAELSALEILAQDLVLLARS